MHSKHIKISKLFYEDEFSKIIRSYNNRDISGSKFCEIVNDKADKLISFNTELLEALKNMVDLFSPTIDSREEIEQENAKSKAILLIEKANK
jgi:cell shape-determining protein MreC